MASLILATPTASFAEEEKNYRYGLRGNNLVFTSSEEAVNGGSFQLAVKGGVPGQISVKLVDIVSSASGAKTSTPLNSTPFTPYQLVDFTKSYPAYQPSDDYQYFDIFLKFKDDIDWDRPVLGGLSISIIPDEQSQAEIAVASSIVATFAYIPASGINLEEYAPALELTVPTIDRKSPDFFPLNLLPNIPLVPNHGDLALSYELENTGSIFLQTSTQVKVEQLGLFGQLEGELFTQSDEAFLVPGQLTQSTVEIAPEDLENAQLGIGIYRFTTLATGEVGDEIETSTSNQQTLVIFPWKQGLIAMFLLILFRKRVFRGFNWALGYGRALRDFRYNTPPKSTPGQEVVLKPAPKLESVFRASAARSSTQAPALSAPVFEANKAWVTEPKLEPRTKLDTRPEFQTLPALDQKKALEIKPDASPKVSAKKTVKFPKLQLPSLPTLQFPKLKLSKLNLSAASKAVLDSLPKPKPRPTAKNTRLANEGSTRATQQTTPGLAAPGPASPQIRPTSPNNPTASPGTSSTGSGTKPLYPYWYQPPKKGSSG